MQRAALALAVVARVAARVDGGGERDRGDHARERAQLVGCAAVIAVAVASQHQLCERRVACVEDAVGVAVECGERLEAVARGGATGERSGRGRTEPG